MTISGKIRAKIKQVPEGVPFGYQDLGIAKAEYVTVAKSLERLVAQKTIQRLKRGVFYKPKKTVFGELKPSEKELLKLYLFEQGKQVAYITGSTLYNRLGLTTQVSNTVKIAGTEKRGQVKVAQLQLKYVKSYVSVNDSNYHLLELLDCCKDLKAIADIDYSSGIAILTNLLNELSDSDLDRLLNYALKYPPRTRALVGAILDNSGRNCNLDKLQESLHPLTYYSLGIAKDILPKISDWNIR